MVAPVAAVVIARAGGQAFVRGSAIAGRTLARGGTKVVQAGARQAIQGARTSAKAGARATTAAGKASGRASSRGAAGATRAGAQGARQAGGGARTAAQHGQGSPVEQLLRGGRQDAPGHARRAGRVGEDANRPRSPLGRAGQPARGVPRPASRSGLGAARTGEAVSGRTAPQRAKSAYRLARDVHRVRGMHKRLRERRKRRPSWQQRLADPLPVDKVKRRLKKRRRRIVVMLLLAFVLALSGLFGAAFLTVARVSDAVNLAAQQQGLTSNAGGMLTNAEPMVQAFVGAGVPEEYAGDFAATASLGIDPRLVAAVAWQESAHFDPDVIACRRDSPAPARARGIMQFLPGTATERGVDPCRPGEAIAAGARYLLEIYERFTSWELALAGYNAGPNRVAGCSCVPQNGETENYVTAVNGKWEEYRRSVPEPRLSGAGAVGTNPGGPLGSTERYVEPQLTATMQALLDQAVPLFGRGRGIGCYDPSRSSGEHPLGRACDFMMAAGNTQPTPEDLEHGWRFACWMVQNAEVLNVRYVIWQQQIWESHNNSAPDRRCAGDRAGDGWGHYGRYDSCTARCLQLQHYDHIHVTVN